MDVVAALAVLGPSRDAAGVAAARARALRALADDVRLLARRVDVATQIDWRSAAADAFRYQAAVLTTTTLERADELDRAADALARHAAIVGDRVAEIEQVLRRAPERLRDLGEGIVRRVAEELEEVGGGG